MRHILSHFSVAHGFQLQHLAFKNIHLSENINRDKHKLPKSMSYVIWTGYNKY